MLAHTWQYIKAAFAKYNNKTISETATDSASPNKTSGLSLVLPALTDHKFT